MNNAFFDIMMIIATLCTGKGQCAENMTICVDNNTFSHSASELEDAYVSCLKKGAWKETWKP